MNQKLSEMKRHKNTINRIRSSLTSLKWSHAVKLANDKRWTSRFKFNAPPVLLSPERLSRMSSAAKLREVANSSQSSLSSHLVPRFRRANIPPRNALANPRRNRFWIEEHANDEESFFQWSFKRYRYYKLRSYFLLTTTNAHKDGREERNFIAIWNISLEQRV